MKPILIWFMMASLIAETTYGGQGEFGGTKAPLPEASVRETAQAMIAEIYKADFDAARSSEQKASLAKRLLADGIATDNDSAGRFALFHASMSLAAQAGDAATMLAAIDEIDRRYQIDVLSVKVAVIPNLVTTLRSRDDHREVAPKIHRLIDDAIAADRYDVAKELVQHALTSATAARDERLRAIAANRMKRVEEIKREFSTIQESLDTLESKPTDPNANLIVGKFRCFLQGNWETGLPMLALGNVEGLKTLAVKELSGVADVEGQVALADAWWAQAETEDGIGKSEIQRHAAEWYRKALPALTGLAKAKAEFRLKAIPPNLDDALRTAATRERPWIDMLEKIDLRKDIIRGNWARTRNGLQVVQDGEVRARIAIPLNYTTAYVFRTRFTPISGELAGATICLPVGNAHAAVVIANPTKFRLLRIYGSKPNDEIEVAHIMESNKSHLLEVHVSPHDTEAEIRVLLDETLVIGWMGPLRALAAKDKPFLEGFRTSTIFSSVEVREIAP